MLIPSYLDTDGRSPVSPITPTSDEDSTDGSHDTEPSPEHPIAQLQGPFEESIRETNDRSASQWIVNIDPQSRRRDLLENDEYERLCGRKWRQRSSERYHPFWKLISQMVFGVHLLARRLAKSEPQVMKILQTHVDEMDGFLQRTTEDFLIIHMDVRTRIQYLSLPLGNLHLFDQMLEDRNFRLSLIAYHDQIEHAIDRFTLAITDTIRDLLKGKEAISVLWHYLLQLSEEGCFESHSLKAFYQAMMDNLEGWLEAFSKLRRRGMALQKALAQLALAVTEMQHRVGVASRKEVRSIKPLKPTRNRSVRKLFSPLPSEKPLPADPLLKPKNSKGEEGTGRKGNVGRTTNATKRESNIPRALSRAKSCSALAMDSSSISTSPPPPVPRPRTASRLSRRLSKPFLPKRSLSEGEKADTTQNRPATAPDRTLKSRSVSMEQLKALWTNTGRPRTQQSINHPPPPPLPQSPPLSPSQSPKQDRTEREEKEREKEKEKEKQKEKETYDTMKEQVSQFLKTDRVVEAWDAMTKSATCSRTLKSAKDWPCSIFRAKSPNAWRARSDLSDAPDEKQMSWVPDEVLNTYTFKQRPEMSPRIHVLSVQMALDEEMSGTVNVQMSGGGGDEISDCDSGSIITALPALPPTPTTTTSATIESVAGEYRARAVECARG
ncbi:hypothetical protein N7520_010800 [Penicillium odoratum]|uniref:uncharacterized protein n=1 Tax=Penicillium odoratum TaxID=1167516 RepID=UPI0025475F80|nr:uncharacterized protein N7520_010800 [Penicillium odoratum]KAJ5745618.1 hypothetical protein N7520_010800 [Penicillium odoratum]